MARRAPAWLAWGLLGLCVALCACLVVQDRRHQASVEAVRERAGAFEKAALRRAGWATPQEMERLQHKIETGLAETGGLKDLLEEGQARYRAVLERAGIAEEQLVRSQKELLAAREALDLWAKTSFPSTDWGAPGPDEGSTCPCPALYDTPLTPRTLVLDMRSDGGVRALVGRTDIYADLPQRVKISEHPLDLDVTRWWVDPEVEARDCPGPPRWFAGAGVMLSSEGLGAAGTVVAPGWAPKVWRWQPRVRPWATAGASQDGGFIAAGLGGSW